MIAPSTPDACLDAIALASVIALTLILYCLPTRRLFCAAAARRVIVPVIAFWGPASASRPPGRGRPSQQGKGIV